MSKLTTLTLAFLLSIASITLRAQQANSTNPGSAKGLVRDTAQNYVLKSATVSVYKASDSTLLSYQVTNNYGEFNFKNLPVNLPLRLDVSHVGYMTSRKQFTIPSGKNTIDLQTIIATRRDVTLNDVVISVPPISMNGDTLEFNAAAFKLDSNAVVEDLLRAIPNITLWGDGQITVNGKEVKSLLVNGKSFFGGDMKLATQNLAKNSVQKIQVYNKSRSQESRADSTMEMNIKLKKGKDIGFFGKIGAGYGTNNRFETDGSINMFTPKMQLAVVGAINNINKIADNTGDLMSSSTFKGVGTNVEYQPDFRAEGITRPSALGANFSYNFIEKPTYELKSTLKSNYFLQGKNADYLADYKTTTSVNSTDKVIENSKTINESSNTTQKFDSYYEYAKKGHNLEFTQEVNFNRGENNNQTFRSSTNVQDVLTSTNNSVNTGNNNNKNFRFGGSYRYSPYIITQKTRFRGFNAEYSLNVYNNESEQLNITEFKSFTGAASNQKFNRKYNTSSDGLRQEFNLTIPDVKRLIFGSKNYSQMNFDLTNKLVLNSDKNTNRVQDLDTLSNTYNTNTYLDNQVRTDLIEETPGLRIQKSFQKSLSNRYYKSFTVRFHPKQLLISQDNKSARSFQNLKRNYSRFAPDAGL
ncbi:MAG TPA: carboxypeptidase regulatory-like domain-containing protein, partial [Pedobacter sp.]|nr:carboxypeptidase regulatory-like domain-containing protein [Pedobacter sp.]